MKLNPLTYGVAALRRCLYFNAPIVAEEIPQLTLSLCVTGLFCVVTYFWRCSNGSSCECGVKEIN